MFIDKILEKYDAVIAGDTEFSNKLLLPKKYLSFKEYKKIICETIFVLTTLQKYGCETVVYEHPDVNAGLLPRWNGDCVLVDFLGLNQVEKPKIKKQPKLFKVGFFFYFSAFDIFGLFANKETQINIAKQLLGGRVLRVSTFPNCLKTGIYIEVENEKGKLEIQEIGINPFDAKGYTPAGCKGLEGTFDTWGVNFSNKNWKKFFDITKFSEEYTNTKELVNVADEGETPLYMTKHEITVNYARGDGLTEMFSLYENIHDAGQQTADELKLNWIIKNFGTIGNLSNQIGVGAISKRLGMGQDKESEYKLARYLYPSGGYAFLDGYHYTVSFLLNIDGGYCKNLKPCQPRILDLVLDMDLQGAYVGSMKSLPYCVGIPCVYSFPKNRDYRPNFYQEYQKLIKKKMLVPGAWVARVTTISPLSFRQDLIFSKIFGSTDFEKALIEDDEGFFVIDDNCIDDLTEKKILAMIPDGAFQLLNNEIIDGVLTHDVIQVIEKYWTKSEQKELWSKLNIDTLIFYDGRYEFDNENFVIEFDKLDDEIHHSFENGCQTVKDKRKAIWTRIETDDGWFGSLQTIRNKMKSDAAIAKDNGDIKTATKLKAGQNGTKNINNSSYGVSGSIFYQTEKPLMSVKDNGDINYYGNPKMGNAVFAQNTTARVRVGAWCMAKGLNGYPVITDGTPFNINEVWSWDWKSKDRHNFGSDYLWRLSRYNKSSQIDPLGRFNVKLSPLGYGSRWELLKLETKVKKGVSIEWVTIGNDGNFCITGTEEKWQDLDNLAYEHVKNLFGELDIFKSDVMRYASKDLYKGAAFQSQANYLFERFDTKKDLLKNKTEFNSKARGYNLSKLTYELPDLSDDGFIHPYTEMLNNIYKNDIADVYIKSVFSPELLGISDFNKSENVTNDYIERGFLPHAPTFRSSKPSPFSLSMFRWNTRKQYEKWVKKVESWESKTGFGVELLFLTEEMVKNKTPLCYSETINKIQRMIDDNTILDSFDERMKIKLEKIRHPQLEKEDEFLNQSSSLSSLN